MGYFRDDYPKTLNQRRVIPRNIHEARLRCASMNASSVVQTWRRVYPPVIWAASRSGRSDAGTSSNEPSFWAIALLAVSAIAQAALFVQSNRQNHEIIAYVLLTQHYVLQAAQKRLSGRCAFKDTVAVQR